MSNVTCAIHYQCTSVYITAKTPTCKECARQHKCFRLYLHYQRSRTRTRNSKSRNPWRQGYVGLHTVYCRPLSLLKMQCWFVHITQYGSIETNLFTSIYVYTRTSSSSYLQTHLLGLQDVNVSFSVVPKSFYTSLATILLFMIPGQKFVRAVSTP